MIGKDFSAVTEELRKSTPVKAKSTMRQTRSKVAEKIKV